MYESGLIREMNRTHKQKLYQEGTFSNLSHFLFVFGSLAKVPESTKQSRRLVAPYEFTSHAFFLFVVFFLFSFPLASEKDEDGENGLERALSSYKRMKGKGDGLCLIMRPPGTLSMYVHYVYRVSRISKIQTKCAIIFLAKKISISFF